MVKFNFVCLADYIINVHIVTSFSSQLGGWKMFIFSKVLFSLKFTEIWKPFLIIMFYFLLFSYLVSCGLTGHRELLVSIRFNEPRWQWSGWFLPDHLGDTQVKMQNHVSGAVSMIRVSTTLCWISMWIIGNSE